MQKILSASFVAAIGAVALQANAPSGAAAAERAVRCNLCFVTMDQDGNVLSSQGANNGKRTGEGVYEVTFSDSVKNCAVLATPFLSPAWMNVNIRPDNKTVRFFATLPAGGQGVRTADSGFSGLIVCR